MYISTCLLILKHIPLFRIKTHIPDRIYIKKVLNSLIKNPVYTCTRLLIKILKRLHPFKNQSLEIEEREYKLTF